MFKKRRGQCIIINNHKVLNAPDRDGTQVDGRLLAELFHQLHFRVTEHKNLTALVTYQIFLTSFKICLVAFANNLMLFH